MKYMNLTLTNNQQATNQYRYIFPLLHKKRLINTQYATTQNT